MESDAGFENFFDKYPRLRIEKVWTVERLRELFSYAVAAEERSVKTDMFRGVLVKGLLKDRIESTSDWWLIKRKEGSAEAGMVLDELDVLSAEVEAYCRGMSVALMQVIEQDAPVVEGKPTPNNRRVATREEQQELVRRMRDEGRTDIEIAVVLWPDDSVAWVNGKERLDKKALGKERNRLEKKVGRLFPRSN